VKKRVWLLLILCLCGWAQAEASPEQVALQFFTSLTTGDYASAAALCMNGDSVQEWAPPVITRDIIYPSIRDLTVEQTEITGETARVLLSLSAVDLQNEEAAWAIAYDLPVWDHLSGEMPDADFTAEDLRDLQTFLQSFTARFSVPVCLNRQEGVWQVNEQATFALWAEDTPLNVRAVSYGRITYDAATLQYEDASDGLPPWKVWLRLESDSDAEELSDFSLENVLCSSTLERHHDFEAFGYQSVAQCWKAYGGAYHAVLRLEALPEEGALRAVRRQNLYTPLYVQRNVSIPFAAVPYDSGVPDGGVQFRVQHYTRIAEEAKLQGWKTAQRTIGDWLDYFEPYVVWVWEDLPQEVRDLPIVNDRYALYMLRGTIEKAAGCFGVYDALFHAEGPGCIPLMNQCNMCAVNDIRYLGADSDWYDFAQRSFELPVLMPLQSGVDLDALLRAMQIEATFSGEMIDYIGEHDSATRLGPRTSTAIDLSGMQRWDGSVLDMPWGENSDYWNAFDDEQEEQTEDEEDFPEEEKGRG